LICKTRFSPPFFLFFFRRELLSLSLSLHASSRFSCLTFAWHNGDVDRGDVARSQFLLHHHQQQQQQHQLLMTHTHTSRRDSLPHCCCCLLSVLVLQDERIIIIIDQCQIFSANFPHLSSLVVVVALLCAPHRRRRLPSDSGGPSSNRFQTTPETSNSEQPAAALDLCHEEEEYFQTLLFFIIIPTEEEEERRANKELVDRFLSIIGIREARFVLENRAAASGKMLGVVYVATSSCSKNKTRSNSPMNVVQRG